MERKTRSAFKLRSGNKPSMAKIAGVSPMKADKDISGVGFQDLRVRKSTNPTVGNKYFYKDKEISLKTYVQKKKELNRKAKEIYLKSLNLNSVAEIPDLSREISEP